MVELKNYGEHFNLLAIVPIETLQKRKLDKRS